MRLFKGNFLLKKQRKKKSSFQIIFYLNLQLSKFPYLQNIFVSFSMMKCAFLRYFNLLLCKGRLKSSSLTFFQRNASIQVIFISKMKGRKNNFYSKKCAYSRYFHTKNVREEKNFFLNHFLSE